MTEHIIRQQGTALQKGAATEDRQEKKAAQAAASAKCREDGVPQQELERFARFLLPKIQAFLPVGRGTTAVRGVEEKSPVKERLDGKKALPYGNAFAFGKQMVNVVSWSGELCA